MERLLPILTIIGLVLGALVAAILSGPFVIIALSVFGLVVAVFLFLTRNVVAMVLGGVAALALVLALLGGLGGISTDGGGVDFNINNALAGALLITGLALAAGGYVASRWDDLAPEWVGYVGAGVLVVAAALAFVFRDQLSSADSMGGILVAVLLLVALWPVVLLMRASSGVSHAE